MNFKYTFGSLLAIPLLPFMHFQGKSIRKKIPKLPEADGFEGKSFQNSDRNLQLIILGDSSMAGVGVNSHKEGFTGSLADDLAKKLNTNITWKIYAKKGYTSKKVTQKLLPQVEETNVDLIVVGVGGNDAFDLTSLHNWKANVKELIRQIRLKYKHQPIVFINMPPIQEIPVFTKLIKFVIGNLIDVFSDELEKIASATENVYYYSRKIEYEDYIKRFNLKNKPRDFFSEDDFHASKLAYNIWGKDVSNFISQNVKI